MTMAKPRMDLSTFVGKLLEEQDGDVLREGVRVLAQALMAIEGTPYVHPDFASKFIDVGVVVLDRPATGLGEAVLPTAGMVDGLPMMANVDLVGYGVQWKQQVSGPPQGRWAWNGLRYFAPSKYIGSEQKASIQFLKLTANPGHGKGGTCFGDSGGPDLLGNVVLGVNSFVTNYNCAGVTYSMRIDRADVLEWVNGFLTE
jgi:hypothetical protein